MFLYQTREVAFFSENPVKKPVFYTELAYPIALLLLALGTALTAYGGLGISMVVAPAYVLHLYVSELLPFFSFGMAEYTLQAVVLLLMMLILRRARLTYLLSFGVAVLYGFALDGAMLLTSLLPAHPALQILIYVTGALICCASIALLFYSYLPPEAYEMLVKEVAGKWKKPVHTVKTVYDVTSLLLAVILSLLFFGELRGIGIGTVICAFVYGLVIRLFQKIFEKLFRFEDRFPWRKFFDESEEKP